MQAKVMSTSQIIDPLLVESVDHGMETGIQVEDALVQPGNAGLINDVLSNLWPDMGKSATLSRVK